jgi:protein disulfide-isomerase A6
MLLQSVVLLPFLLISSVSAASGSFYKKSPVLELDSSNFDEVVLKTNQSSVVEFYAPWCGHCQRLKPEYDKVGKYLNDVAIVGAVNCDLAKNKKLCSTYRIEGYPTILSFRPPKFDLNKPTPVKYGHASEIFNGPRKAKNLVDFMSSRIKNYVKRLITLDKLNAWLSNPKSVRPKVVVFTRKDKLTALLKSIAVDLLGAVDFAYVPLNLDKKEIFEAYDIDQTGTTSVLYYVDSEGNKTPYAGELSKKGILQFLNGFEELKESTDKVYERLEFLKKVQNGEKIKKPVRHDEL